MVTMAIERLEWLKWQLAQGWRVESPVIERTLYYSLPGQESTFEFILRHEQGCQVVAIPDCPELHTFIKAHALAVASA
ncbi:MAG: hypothetical protein GFH27_549285n70 [Chloroflexi bacterium AL-W]|nr:hypothetical protein [Chloroflexi bacterium AL-N1]NOK65582.1 hypothetical protein [Chloroflexi bacterium AL-N10]NOK74477.1 hypothetical protein [Chloroflexi bacterium AL-N5]NOK80615.1 hypothetical protein [Chloroflexi bacterium AL-W]NOK88735.1 hypothetical protein [Chloroflexi bacterium AL-N15]